MRRSIFLLFGCLSIFPALHAQVGDLHIESTLKTFEIAWSEQNYSFAAQTLRKIISKYPDHLWKISEQAESFYSGQYIENSDRELDHGALDTLILIYDASILKDNFRRYDWEVKKALLMLNYPDYFSDKMEASLELCLKDDPVMCPPLLIESLIDLHLEKYLEDRNYLESLVRLWAETDHFLELRSYLDLESKEEVNFLRTRIRNSIRRSLPPCETSTSFYYELSMAEDSEADSWQALLGLIFLQDCKLGSPLEEIIQKACNENAAAYWLRMSAKMTSDSELPLLLLEKAGKRESEYALKAATLVMIADQHLRNADFRKAKQSLEMAILVHPQWGEPYLKMADLFVTGSGFCDFTVFEKKTVYWAAIDFCQSAKNTDPASSKAAIARIFEYSMKMPSKEEVAFRGLTPGDTFPIQCWMSTATTVKVR